jgi:hypothetical protein
MAIHIAYWIDPNGVIFDIGMGTHISKVISSPEKFATTKNNIIVCYKKYNEVLGVEGKARQEIIFNILKLGFIRIRLVVNNHWSISSYYWDKQTKLSLKKWAKIAKEVKSAGLYMDTVISTPNMIIREYTVEDLYKMKHIIESEKILSKMKARMAL